MVTFFSLVTCHSTVSSFPFRVQEFLVFHFVFGSHSLQTSGAHRARELKRMTLTMPPLDGGYSFKARETESLTQKTPMTPTMTYHT
jgi:hypothetical protein